MWRAVTSSPTTDLLGAGPRSQTELNILNRAELWPSHASRMMATHAFASSASFGEVSRASFRLPQELLCMPEFFGLCKLTHIQCSSLIVRGGGDRRPDGGDHAHVKQLGMSIAIAMAIVGAGAFGIVLSNTALHRPPPTASRLQRLISGSMIISGSERRFWAKKALSCP